MNDLSYMHDKKMLGQSFIDQAVYQEGRSTTEHVLAVNTGVKRLIPSTRHVRIHTG